MIWRSWSKSNPCPACGGSRWAGESAKQCRGGYNPDAPTRAWCSTQDSGDRSASGMNSLWILDAEYPWRTEARSTAGFSERASSMPGDLWHEGGWSRTGRWVYRTAECDYAFEVQRFDHTDGRKTYRPGQAVREGGDRIRWGLPQEARIPYQLPRLLKAFAAGLPLYIAEGEKSCDAINGLDPGLYRFTATCNPGGSAQWRTMPSPERWFVGAQNVTVIVDRDAAGRAWARDVLATIPHARLVQSRTTAPSDDVVDHMAAGWKLDELEEIT